MSSCSITVRVAVECLGSCGINSNLCTQNTCEHSPFSQLFHTNSTMLMKTNLCLLLYNRKFTPQSLVHTEAHFEQLSL